MIRKTLWISAVLTVIALIPGTIVMGLYLFILRGLILAVAPTIFVYGVAFELLRIGLRTRSPIRPGFGLNVIAGRLAMALGFALADRGSTLRRPAVRDYLRGDLR